METIKDVPSLDADNRWNSLFIMIDLCYELASVLDALSNKPEFSGKLNKLTQFEWRQIKSIKDFLQRAFELTTMVSGTQYATLGLQPFIFESLESFCNDTINGTLETGFTTLFSKQAAQAMLSKFDKNKDNMNSEIKKLAVVLDPATLNVDSDIHDLKKPVQNRISTDYIYGNSINSNVEEVQSKPLSLL